MKVSDIQIGKTYRNKGKGRTHRKVLAIVHDGECLWLGAGSPPNEPVVKFLHKNGQFTGQKDALYISSFAQWVGGEVDS